MLDTTSGSRGFRGVTLVLGLLLAFSVTAYLADWATSDDEIRISSGAITL